MGPFPTAAVMVSVRGTVAAVKGLSEVMTALQGAETGSAWTSSSMMG
jgi:hypothetical protein